MPRENIAKSKNSITFELDSAFRMENGSDPDYIELDTQIINLEVTNLTVW